MKLCLGNFSSFFNLNFFFTLLFQRAVWGESRLVQNSLLQEIGKLLEQLVRVSWRETLNVNHVLLALVVWG